MANPQQYSQVRCVICESYKPDTTFRVNEANKRTANLAFSQMPIECILAEIHLMLSETEHIVEFYWFRTHYEIGTPWCQIALMAGMKYGSGNHIKDRCDLMLNDTIDKMPNWLFNRCIDIYDEFLKGGIND